MASLTQGPLLVVCELGAPNNESKGYMLYIRLTNRMAAIYIVKLARNFRKVEHPCPNI